MSVILTELLNTKHHVVAVCTSEPDGLKRQLRAVVGRFLRRVGLRPDNDFFFENPFSFLEEPKLLAKANGIPTFAPAEIQSTEFADILSNTKPDIIIVAGFHRKIPPSVYELARKAAVNFHPSLLPNHRGGTPNRWIVFAGENQTGMTIHHLSAEFDTGSIILSESVPITVTDCWGDVEKRLLASLPSVLDRLLKICADGPLPAQPQIEEEASYEPSFRGQHARADWNDGPETFLRRCLALRPKTGVHGYYEGKPLCIWDIGTGPEISQGIPGEVVSFDEKGNPVVRCSSGSTVTILQALHRGRLTSGAEMARRLNCKVGGRFG